ncbi:MAG: hypothetical protein N4A44_02145 [Alphaproteobacteria bacterium]|jgi:DNA gyrase/topoisomerase IV subunit A|nr:hypothetical protein [Alphaproteobacteria bacterium]
MILSKLIYKKISLIIIPLNLFFYSVSSASEIHCLTSSEEELIKTRVLKDNLLFAIRNCDFSKEELVYITFFENFFKSQDIKLINMYKSLYGKYYKKHLNNFITENSNQASIKYSYNNSEFCNSYKLIISKSNTQELRNRLTKFKLAKQNGCE